MVDDQEGRGEEPGASAPGCRDDADDFCEPGACDWCDTKRLTCELTDVFERHQEETGKPGTMLMAYSLDLLMFGMANTYGSPMVSKILGQLCQSHVRRLSEERLAQCEADEATKH